MSKNSYHPTETFSEMASKVDRQMPINVIWHDTAIYIGDQIMSNLGTITVWVKQLGNSNTQLLFYS